MSVSLEGRTVVPFTTIRKVTGVRCRHRETYNLLRTESDPTLINCGTITLDDTWNNLMIKSWRVWKYVDLVNLLNNPPTLPRTLRRKENSRINYRHKDQTPGSQFTVLRFVKTWGRKHSSGQTVWSFTLSPYWEMVFESGEWVSPVTDTEMSHFCKSTVIPMISTTFGEENTDIWNSIKMEPVLFTV